MEDRMKPVNIQIQEEVLKSAATEGIDNFIEVFTRKYEEVIRGVMDSTTLSLLNGYQHSLYSYILFRNEMMDGGFVQLFQNGYGPYLFENPFAKAMREFGAAEFSKLLYKAKEEYDKHKVELEKDCTDEEFMAKYERFEQFDELEEEFMEMEEEVTSILAHYVDGHLEQFAEIVK